MHVLCRSMQAVLMIGVDLATGTSLYIYIYSCCSLDLYARTPGRTDDNYLTTGSVDITTIRLTPTAYAKRDRNAK